MFFATGRWSDIQSQGKVIFHWRLSTSMVENESIIDWLTSLIMIEGNIHLKGFKNRFKDLSGLIQNEIFAQIVIGPLFWRLALNRSIKNFQYKRILFSSYSQHFNSFERRVLQYNSWRVVLLFKRVRGQFQFFPFVYCSVRKILCIRTLRTSVAP